MRSYWYKEHSIWRFHKMVVPPKHPYSSYSSYSYSSIFGLFIFSSSCWDTRLGKLHGPRLRHTPRGATAPATLSRFSFEVLDGAEKWETMRESKDAPGISRDLAWPRSAMISRGLRHPTSNQRWKHNCQLWGRSPTDEDHFGDRKC